MVIKITRWSPDTCGCVIDYAWDDAVPENQRTVSFNNIVTKCPAHTILTTNNDVWTAINDENPRKNVARQLLLDNAPNTIYDIIDVSNGTRDFKSGISLNWIWSGTAPNRVLNLTVTGATLTNAQKNTIRNILNTRFGAGKIVLN